VGNRHCVKSCGSDALTNHDLCLDCIHAELAARRRKRKPRKPKAQTFTVSVSAGMYERLKKAARKQRTSMRRLVEEACR